MIVERCPKPFSVVIVASALLCLSACRYQDNDRIALQSIYKRLCKTWILKSAVVQSSGVELLDTMAVYRDRWLSIERSIRENEIFFNCESNPFISCTLDQNKTIIYQVNRISEGSLKIIKLTKDELWLRGQPIVLVLGGGGLPDEIYTFSIVC